MAQEIIRDLIKITAGSPAEINAYVKGEDGEYITSDCAFMLHDKDGEMIFIVEGNCDGSMWNFTIPAELTADLEGKYSYCIMRGEESICFRQPFYVMR